MSKNQHGGVRLSPLSVLNTELTPQDFFYQFLNHCSLSIFSSSTRGGILFEAKINDANYSSPYELCRSNFPFEPVNEILFKVSFSNSFLNVCRLFLSDTVSVKPRNLFIF